MFLKTIIIRKMALQWIIDFPLKNFCYYNYDWIGAVIWWLVERAWIFVQRGHSNIFKIVQEYNGIGWFVTFQTGLGVNNLLYIITVVY